MKNITLCWEDEVFDSANQAAAQMSMPLGEFLRDLFLSQIPKLGHLRAVNNEPSLQSLWALADSHPLVDGPTAGMSRDKIYERGISRH
jgi:hypothetical protein